MLRLLQSEIEESLIRLHGEPTLDSIDAEISAIEQASAIDEELAAMKAPAKKAPRKKAK